MTGEVIGVCIGLLVSWLALVAALLVARPTGNVLKETLRLLPDVLRLLRRLATDPTLPRGVRWRLVLLFAYLAMPFDLVPDFIPVIGYADDAILVTLVLRSVSKRAGSQAIIKHWPGSTDGLNALSRLCGLSISN